MTPLLARMYAERERLNIALQVGCFPADFLPRRIRVACLIIALEHRQARRAS